MNIKVVEKAKMMKIYVILLLIVTLIKKKYIRIFVIGVYICNTI